MGKDKEEMKRHELVPVHKKLSDKDKKSLLEKHNITFKQLPKIASNDAGLAGVEVKDGDVVEITRQSPVVGTSVYYRGVSDD